MTCLNLVDMQKSHMLRFFLKVASEGCPNILVIFLQIRRQVILKPHFLEVGFFKDKLSSYMKSTLKSSQIFQVQDWLAQKVVKYIMIWVMTILNNYYSFIVFGCFPEWMNKNADIMLTYKCEKWMTKWTIR